MRHVLERTLGVPIFQEQVIELAMVAAGFSAGEADQLRRAMAAWKRKGQLQPYEAKLAHGLLSRGYSEDFSRRIISQIRGFGEYGFPESHAASFALLVYASAWLKCHEPAAFCCAPAEQPTHGVLFTIATGTGHQTSSGRSTRSGRLKKPVGPQPGKRCPGAATPATASHPTGLQVSEEPVTTRCRYAAAATGAPPLSARYKT